MIGKLIGSDKIAFASNQDASAIAHMAPDMKAGSMAWLYTRGRFLIQPQ